MESDGAKASAGDPADGQPARQVGEEPDSLLRFLISLADQNIEISVTLMVGGIIITGMVTSGAHYFSELAEGMSASTRTQSGDEEGGNRLRADLAATLTQMGESYKNSAKNEDYPPSLITYIHLHEAQFMAPDGSFEPRQSLLWRGKLSSVDGFAIGKVSRVQ